MCFSSFFFLFVTFYMIVSGIFFKKLLIRNEILEILKAFNIS